MTGEFHFLSTLRLFSCTHRKRHGEIADSPVGTLYKDKSVLRAAGVHCNQQGGIYGDNENGAYSISM